MLPASSKGIVKKHFTCHENDAVSGLSHREASLRLKKNGYNELSHVKKASLFSLFLAQFEDFMVIVLLAAALVSFAVSLWGNGEKADPFVILIIVLLNACVGVIQERRAEAALSALNKLQSPRAVVIRDGHRKSIPSRELVIDDIVLLQGGDVIPADGILLEGSELTVDESILTGESQPIGKRSSDTLYASTALLSGHGKMSVTRTGMETEVGKIADMLRENRTPQTPLQKKLSRVSIILGSAALVVCFAVFLLGLYRRISFVKILLIAVSLAVAAIPEGLPAIVTVMLALGVRRMTQKKCIVRRLPAVETLGSVQAILSDKTGTLTVNRLSVSSVSGDETMTLAFAMLASNRSDATEEALFREGEKRGIPVGRYFPGCERIGELPFSSDRKRMTVAVKDQEGYLVVMKGGGDIVLPFCSSLPQDRYLEEWTLSGQRVLAVAFYRSSFLPHNIEDHPFRLCGLIALEDPVRSHACGTISLCYDAGIRILMATGDHPSTARAIAVKAGFRSADRVMIGNEIDRMDDKALSAALDDTDIFARVTPLHKLRLIKALQNKGLTVAMTGDGVNDAPALKAADIGLAMGKNGSEVARQASDMILTDSNFSCILDAVREGRTVYQNVRKALHFLLSCNIGEILVVFTSLLFGIRTPLSPVQLLWVNLVTDSLPALALGFEAPDRDCMKEGPITSNSIFSGFLGFKILLEGIMIGVLSLGSFYVGALFLGGESVGITLCFGTLSFSQLIHVFNVRSDRSLFFTNPFSNKKLNRAILCSAFMQGIVMFLPSLRPIFYCEALSLSAMLTLSAFSLFPIIFSEIIKLVIRPETSSQ